MRYLGIFAAFLAAVVISLLLSKKNKKEYSGLDEEGYYDMHCHILPGVDHGALDMDTAISMIRKESEEGIRHIALTSHYYAGHEKKELYSAQFDKLCLRVENEQIPVKLYKGNEMACTGEAIQDLDDGKVFPLGDTSYVLVEFHTSDTYSYISSSLMQIQRKGYRPVVAHLERYEALHDEQAVRDLVRQGILMQANAGSFTKKRIGKYLVGLAQKDLIHVIGSDCHDLASRPPGIRGGLRVLRRELKKEQYDKICFENPAHILENQYL